jgi:hypothetical protein
MKLKLKWRRFDTIEIQAKTQSAWHSDRKGLSRSFPKIETVVPVLHRGGNYFEGDGGR